MSRSIQSLVESKVFHHAIVAVIVLAGVLAGLETSPAIMATHGATLLALDKAARRPGGGSSCRS